MLARRSCTPTLRLGRHLSAFRPDCSLVTVSAGNFTGHESPSMAQRSEQACPAPPRQTQLERQKQERKTEKREREKLRWPTNESKARVRRERETEGRDQKQGGDRNKDTHRWTPEKQSGANYKVDRAGLRGKKGR